ncbi:MAG: cation transporter [Spirochaetaceae bacterium]|nr:cation transporter [Spirochaetaceae bacterium]
MKADDFTSKNNTREKTIVRTSFLGIGANVLLAAFKAFIGIVSNSIAITLDAVNNLSDAFSSVITIVGTKLAAKPADKKHPFGYGRLEYLSAMVISVIILYAGVTSLVESVKKIISPAEPEYTLPSIIILSVAVIVKIVMGLHVKSVGQKVNSDSLVASGKDAIMDSVISIATIIAAIVFIFTGFKLEAYLGLIISIMIIKAGFETMKETISEILGERASEDLIKGIKESVLSVDGVLGVYDLVLNNYGPDSFVASVHIEVADETTAVELDKIQWKISEKVYLNHGVSIAAIGIYPSNTSNTKTSQIKNQLKTLLADYPEVIEMHGLYLNDEDKLFRMDIIINFDAKDRYGLYKEIYEKVCTMLPEYKVIVNLDLDFSTTRS